MAVASDDSTDVEKLYQYGENLNESQDKSQVALRQSNWQRSLFPGSSSTFRACPKERSLPIFDLCEEEELGVRVQAIRGLPLFCKDTPEYVSKIVDILGQLLTAGENVERDAVHKALLSLLRQDVKVLANPLDRLPGFYFDFGDSLSFQHLSRSLMGASLTSLFKHIGSSEEPCTDEIIREKVLCFVRDKVFPLKAELLKPQEQMERHITDLVKKSLQDVTGAEFKLFMDFLRSLSLFGQKAPAERVQELIEIIEEQADLDAQFDVSACF
ncbi:Apoptosis inhibitor 5-like protein API5 [Vitis vinifera]|uniref:Apoptosis inhibitor 5-like protein API5 n=1 Tax=Vitis vinifera TaxID=29760 RepID=A0A438J4H1_VITVI|nr:Apoptosis inhibitor 5-like protein API5 [Vitis vinifera]